MAPLVAGVVLLGAAPASKADYAHITSIYYRTTYNVRCEYTGTIYSSYWWFGGTQIPSLNGYSDVNTYPGYTNVCVYMFSVDESPSNQYSWASIDSVWGTTIYNGP